jgi:tRNA(fMet)-specific endonuclease VapC
MRKVLLDTSAYSAFLRGSEAIKSALQNTDEIYLCPVIIGELLSGFIRGRTTSKNRKELQTFLSSPRVKIADIDTETAERYAIILNYLWEKGNPIPTNDIWIAASAMQYGLIVITSDAHYKEISQVITEYYNSNT